MEKIHNLLKVTNISILFRTFINVKSDDKQKYGKLQHNKSKLKDTHRLKKTKLSRAKYNSVTSKKIIRRIN